MRKPSDFLNEGNWFKGTGYGGGLGKAPRGGLLRSTDHCLGSAVSFEDYIGMDKIVDIIKRLYPERVWTKPVEIPGHPQSWAIVMGFNNNPATTWEEIAKVMREYEIEMDLQGEE